MRCSDELIIHAVEVDCVCLVISCPVLALSFGSILAAHFHQRRPLSEACFNNTLIAACLIQDMLKNQVQSTRQTTNICAKLQPVNS